MNGGSGPTSHGLLARWDPSGCSWKTYQGSLLSPGESLTFSGPWPHSGTMQNGRISQQEPLEPPTAETESSSWPTPDAAVSTRSNRSPTPGAATRPLLAAKAQAWPTPRAEDSEFAGAHRGVPDGLVSATRLWPTPKTPTGGSETRAQKAARGSGGEDLEARAKGWPTPRANEGGQHNSHDNGVALSKAVTQWPTPKARDVKGTSQRGTHKPGDALPNMVEKMFPSGPPAPETQKDGRGSSPSGPTSHPQWQTPGVADTQGGHLTRSKERSGELLLKGQAKAMTGSPRLNPAFVEWLMNLPPGWTGFGALGTEWSRYRRRWRSWLSESGYLRGE